VYLVHVGEPLLAALGALWWAAGGALDALALCAARLPRPCPPLELGGQVLEVSPAVGVSLHERQLRLEPVQLGLALGQLELALVELCRPADGLLRDAALLGELTLEPLGLGAQPVLLEEQLGLALADHLVLGGDAGSV